MKHIIMVILLVTLFELEQFSIEMIRVFTTDVNKDFGIK